MSNERRRAVITGGSKGIGKAINDRLERASKFLVNHT